MHCVSVVLGAGRGRIALMHPALFVGKGLACIQLIPRHLLVLVLGWLEVGDK